MARLEEFDFDMPDNGRIQDAFIKCRNILAGHTKVMVSLSGGADSDMMMDIIEKCKWPHNEIFYVFFDTGIEFEATKRHLKYLEEHYGITIEKTKPKKTIPKSCLEDGQPFLTKAVSENISRLQRHNFQWEDGTYEELSKKYPKCLSALKWWCNDWGDGSSFNIERRSWLKEFMLENPPDFKIGQKCCQYAKKEIAKKWKKEHYVDLSCIGIRKAEGGNRATIYKNCFTKKEDEADEFRPVFWLTDDDRKQYIKYFNLKLSDCYTVYGLPRTGCSGCPYSHDFKKEVAVLDEFEPKLGKAVRNIFKDAYAYQEKYYAFRDEHKEQEGSYAKKRRIEKGVEE